MQDDLAATATWPSLLDAQRQTLGISEASRPRRSVTDESSFRDAFEALCDDHDEQYHQRHLAGLIRPFKSIVAFTKAIDSSASLEPPVSLTSLLWAATYRVVEKTLDAGIINLKHAVELLGRLNKSFPNFGADLTRYPHDDSVQQPLRLVYSTYIHCHEEMISCFATQPPPLEFTQLNVTISTASQIIQDAKEQWERALSAAATNEERQRLLTASVPASVPNGFDGESLGPHPVNVHFKVVRHLGSGTHGNVFEVKETSTGSVYARKLIGASPNTRQRESTERRVKEEVGIMHKLRHHHIASCLFWTREREYFSIIMLPVAEYDLRYFLEHECVFKNYPIARIRQLDNWFGCLASALQYAHGQEIEHKDIKPTNILIKNNQPYLADFGCATDFSEHETSTSTDNLFAGTPAYYAPEERPWGRAADVFALGCVYSEMITVRYGRSLQDYRDYRFKEHSDNGWAFCSNLPKVREWLDGLDNGRGDESLQLVVEQTQQMLIETIAQRPRARIVRNRLRGHSETLFCDNC